MSGRGGFLAPRRQQQRRVSVSYVLDQLSIGARAAYSFRRLRAAYTGPLVRLRRTTDNAESDFGPGAGGVVSESEVLAWVGAGNTARCVTLYDQSGNGHHATQTTAGNQPEVVSAGVWRGGLYSAAAGQVMNLPATAVSGLTSASVSAVAARLSTYPGYYKIGAAGQDTHHPFGDANIYTDFFALNRVSVGGATIPAIGVKHLLTETNDGTTLTVYQKNISRGTATITFATPTTRNFPSSTNNGLGCGNELILFASVLTTTDRNTLTADQITAWSIA